MNRKIQLPAIFAIDEKWNKNSIQQLIQPTSELEVVTEHYQKNRVKGYVLTSTNSSKEQILAIYNQARPPKEFNKVLRVKPDNLVENDSKFVDLSDQKWIKHPKLLKVPKRRIDYKKRIKAVLDSWQEAFSYKTEDKENGLNGLRPPQIGAVHATHAHWTVTDEVATIVMPTGTGKTETMLSILISKRCKKLLVVVPTDALRTQIADKFLTLGILKDFGIVSTKGLYPIVGILKHKPKDYDDVDTFFEKCNVIVTTMHIAGLRDTDIQERMAHHCPYLFIDEAHHTPAQTWKTLKQKFASKKVLQFTATPFRNDGKEIEGKIIFDYPLKKAQDEGYFKRIYFKSVRVHNSEKADQIIAESAVRQLREDLNKYNHIVMARVNSIKRAEEVLSIYQNYEEFRSILIHSNIKSKEKEQIRQRIINGEYRIIICVDMLGEGFDLPELKIAAFHDIRKSSTVTLQIAGRFIRPRQDVGDATFIANIANANVRGELKKLYYQYANWNTVLQELSDGTVQEKIDFQEFVTGFQNSLTDISLLKLRPAMSTVIYKTECENWIPENFKEGIHASESFNQIEDDINRQKSTLIIVTARKIPIDWAQSTEIFSWDWELCILFWNQEQNLLFIHSSSNSGYYKRLAEAVAGKVELIKGEHVFRCLSGINRFKLHNVGLREQLGRLIGYTMRTGSDVKRGLAEAQTEQTTKSNIFGTGYENGTKVSIGCSGKGRIWAYRKGNINSLRKWCSAVGSKILDETVNLSEILEKTLTPEIIPRSPQKIPFGIEWPEMVYKELETTFAFIIDEETLPFFKTDIKLTDYTEGGELKFEICSDTMTIKLILTIFDGNYEFSIVGNKSVSVKWRQNSQSLEKFFYDNPPIISFVDGSSLEGNIYTESKKDLDPYNRKKIKTWNWNGVDLMKELQGRTKEKNSIQYRVIRELKRNNYDLIFDDHDSGEAADVVCINTRKRMIMVEFYHCKSSQASTPGRRIDDLCEVCSQAQKSIRWMEKENIKLFDHLLGREALRKDRGDTSRFERGNEDKLWEIREMSIDSFVELKIFIVQPGLSKSKASTAQLELLSVTENYLLEKYQVPFGVIASD